MAEYGIYMVYAIYYVAEKLGIDRAYLGYDSILCCNYGIYMETDQESFQH